MNPQYPFIDASGFVGKCLRFRPRFAHGRQVPALMLRTGATMMQKLGVGLDIIDRCQNHVLAGSKVRHHYMHHDYAEEKRAAWATLGNRLSEVL